MKTICENIEALESAMNAVQSHCSAFLSKTMSKGELIDKLAHDAMDRLKSTTFP